MKLSRIIILTALISCLGCGLGHNASSSSNTCQADPPDVHQKRLTAYQTTLEAYLQGQVCVNCHGGVGSSAPYLFTSPDPATAYGAMQPLVNFATPSQSAIVSQINNGHNCQPNCGTMATTITSDIAAWAQAESGLPVSTCSSATAAVTFTLPPQAINPSTLSATQDTSFRWNLTSINPSLGNLAFQISARTFSSDPTVQSAYQLWKPVVAADHKVKVTDLRITVNGTVDQNANDFVDTSFVVAPMPFTYSSPSWGPFLPVSQSINLRVNNGVENIGFEVDVASSTDPASTVPISKKCLAGPGDNPDDFSGPVQNNIFNNQTYGCVNCHGGANTMATGKFDMSQNANVCLDALLQSTYSGSLPQNCSTAADATQASSQVFMLSHILDPGHGGGVITLSTTDICNVVNWLKAEAAAGN